MTARRATTPTVAVKPRRPLAEIAAWCVGGAFLLSMCGQQAEQMSAGGAAKAATVAGAGGAGVGVGAGGAALGAFCLKFPEKCIRSGGGDAQPTPTAPPVTTPVTTPQTTPPTVAPPAPGGGKTGPRPTVPPAPSIPPVSAPKSFTTRTTTCLPMPQPIIDGVMIGGVMTFQQVCQ